MIKIQIIGNQEMKEYLFHVAKQLSPVYQLANCFNAANLSFLELGIA